MNDDAKARQVNEKRRILVVDDDRDFADTLANLLKLEGCDTVIAHNIPAAESALNGFAAEIALIDIRLGETNGLSLASKFRETNPELTCIMMTAYASVETAVAALQGGAYDYLRKPFYTQDLMATINRCFERGALVRDRDRAEATLKARNQELVGLNARLKQLVNGMQMLSTCETVGELCKKLVEQAVAVTDAGNSTVTLEADGGEAMEFRAGTSQGPTAAPGTTAETDPIRRAISTDPGLLIEVPILGTGRDKVGALTIGAAAKRAFTEQDRELAQILASYASEAIRLLHALERVSRSEARLRNIIDNSPSLISLQDLASRLIVVNNRFEEWLGCSGAEAIGKVASDILPPEAARIFYSHIDEDLSGRQEVYEELEITFADGTVHSILITRFPALAGDGNLIGIGTVATDVTDHRRTEEHLRQARKMEALGHLTGGVAHDFNNLLAVISGNLSLLADDTDGDADAAELIEDARSAAQSGAELTSQLLAFGRRQTLRPQHTDTFQLLEKMCRILKRTLGEAIHLRHDLASDLWPIEIDRSQLETGLLNLALNARDAMPQGGSLQISAENVTLDRRTRPDALEAKFGQFVAISVSDSGSGMAAEVAEQAVQPFFTTKDAGLGSGLGLSMVYGFAEQSGGNLEISSTVGEGTSVQLLLPRARASFETRAATDNRPAGLASNGERVLIVEDGPSVRKLAKRILTRLGYDVLEAGDADTALTILAETADIDLLFTDIVLPGGMSGVELAKTAKARHPGLKTLYTSGYARGLVLDVQDPSNEHKLVPKPFQKEELGRMVKLALDGEIS